MIKSTVMRNKTGIPIVTVCVRAVVIKNKKILLTYTEDGGYYYFPGGHLEYEESLVEACQRELKEEAHAIFTFQKILYVREYTDQKNLEHSVEFFIAGGIDKDQEVDNFLDPESSTKGFNSWLRWVDLPGLRALDVRPREVANLVLSDNKLGFKNETRYLLH